MLRTANRETIKRRERRRAKRRLQRKAVPDSGTATPDAAASPVAPNIVQPTLVPSSGDVPLSGLQPLSTSHAVQGNVDKSDAEDLDQGAESENRTDDQDLAKETAEQNHANQDSDVQSAAQEDGSDGIDATDDGTNVTHDHENKVADLAQGELAQAEELNQDAQDEEQTRNDDANDDKEAAIADDDNADNQNADEEEKDAQDDEDYTEHDASRDWDDDQAASPRFWQSDDENKVLCSG
jgi:hypothetical protein